MVRTFGFRRAAHTGPQPAGCLRIDVLAALSNWMMVREIRSIEPVEERGDSFFCTLHSESDESLATRQLEFECSRFGIAPIETQSGS